MSRTRLLLALLLLSVWCNVLQLYASWVLSGRPSPPVVPDTAGSRCPDRADVWMPQSMPLGGTEFTANAGPWEYPRTPQFYSVSVEKPYPGGSRVVFEQQFRVDELPEGFLERPIREVATYDPASGTVTFMLGEKRVEYRLPATGAATSGR